ncbi:MAG: hypothetical protein Tsb0020_40260 [Haliangiales bacterium]
MAPSQKPTPAPGPPDIPADIAAAVVRYFRAAKRDLPWRQRRDPYATWVSEIMLQQTRVATVIPYFERWMTRFPDVAALATAPLDDVLALWSGLGYYSRARNLHRGAQVVMAEHGGALPKTAAGLRALPGIGRYTAGAIASIAYGLPEPLVDGNVARVLARLYALEGDIKSSATTRALWQLATELVPDDSPGDFNQGLMELGATVCTPTKPTCLLCPLAERCAARQAGRERELPRTGARKRPAELPQISAQALWIERHGQLLLGRRHPRGLFGGLLELPQTGGSGDPDDLLSAVLSARYQLLSPQPVHEHRQVLTHRRLHIQVFAAHLAAKSPARLGKVGRQRYDKLIWHRLDTLAERGLSAATQSILSRYRETPTWSATSAPSSFSPRATKKSSPGSPSSATTPTTPTSPAPPRARPKASTSSSTSAAKSRPKPRG